MNYWLRLLADTDLLDNKGRAELIADVEELLRIIGSIQKTLKRK